MTCLLIAGVPALSGCMMTGAMGGMSGMSSATHAPMPRSVIGETRTASARVTLEFPAVTAGKDAVLLVRVQDGTGAPVSHAHVTVVLQRDGSEAPAIAVEAAESAPGVYEAAHRIDRAGVHTATAEVMIDGPDPRSVVSIAVQQEVASATDSPARRSPRLPVAIVGAAAMAAMMVLMIAF